MTHMRCILILLIPAISSIAIFAGCGPGEVSQETEEASHHLIQQSSLPDLSTPEKTLRTFWWAIRNGEREMALGCIDGEKTAAGRHGVDADEFISEFSGVDTSDFRYIVGDGRVSIQSRHHNMDYDMERTEDGRWLIVSIHP